MVRAAPAPIPISSRKQDDDEEKPLDPAVERVRQRLKRLILVSSATLLVGVAAVLVAVLYRIGPVRDKPVPEAADWPASIEAAIPSSARILSSALDGGTLALTIEDAGRIEIVVLDLAGGRVARRLALGPATAGN